MFCANCGAYNTDGTKFCIECGTTLYSNTQITSQAEPRENDDVETIAVQQRIYEQGATNQNRTSSQQEYKQSKKGLVTGIVISIFILVMAVIVSLFVSGVIDVDTFKKEEITQEIKESFKEEQTSEIETSEEETAEETVTEDPNLIAKQNLVGVWNVTVSLKENGELIEHFLPVVTTFGSDGTFAVTLDEEAYEKVIWEYVEDALVSSGYYDFSEEEKAQIFAQNGVKNEEELREELFKYSAETQPITDFSVVIDNLPMPSSGYWAVNGENLYLTTTETQRDAFLKNPNAYRHDVIKTKLTRGEYDFTLLEGEENFILSKQ